MWSRSKGQSEIIQQPINSPIIAPIGPKNSCDQRSEMDYRNMPLALLSGIFTVSAVYFSINLAYFAVLDVETVKSSNAVAAVSRELL